MEYYTPTELFDLVERGERTWFINRGKYWTSYKINNDCIKKYILNDEYHDILLYGELNVIDNDNDNEIYLMIYMAKNDEYLFLKVCSGCVEESELFFINLNDTLVCQKCPIGIRLDCGHEPKYFKKKQQLDWEL